jgi:hypothetical protein
METGAIDGNDGNRLVDAHRLFKGVENRLGLSLDHRGLDQPFTRDDLNALEPFAGPESPPRRSGETLADYLTRVMADVRTIYLKHLG